MRTSSLYCQLLDKVLITLIYPEIEGDNVSVHCRPTLHIIFSHWTSEGCHNEYEFRVRVRVKRE